MGSRDPRRVDTAAGIAIAVLIAAFALSIIAHGGPRGDRGAPLGPTRGSAKTAAFCCLTRCVTPLAAILNAAYGWFALFMRRTTWAGITYEITGPKQVKVLSRRPTM